MAVTRQYLEEAIMKTKQEIDKIKEQIENTTNSLEVRRLTRRKRELQYLQLWHIDLYERMTQEEKEENK